MLTTALASASLIPRGGPFLATATPRIDTGRRPSVLARPPQVSQQLSLFGPPGGRR